MALNYGRMMALGTPTEVQSHPEVIRAYIGGDA
jgi:branched-chain amino acid transport system ATP-binding protein